MTDVQANAQAIQTEVQAFDEKVNKLENALESLNQTVETQAQSPDQIPLESRQESPILSITKRSIYDTVKVTEDLDTLHHKIDDILLRNQYPLVLSTHHITDMIHTTSSPTVHTELLTYELPRRTHHLNDVINTASLLGAQTELLKHGLARSTYISESHAQYPRYDKQKLDDIVGRILNVRYAPSRVYESSPYLHLLESKYSNVNPEVYTKNAYTDYLETRYTPLRIYESKPHQSSTYFNSQIQEPSPFSPTKLSKSPKLSQKVEKTIKPAPTHHIGLAENDVDSLIIDHIKEVQDEVNKNNQQYNNFYVGTMNEDIDDVPRTKRLGKRQEISQAKKQNNYHNSELVEKSVYDQKKNQKSNTEQAKKALNASASVQEDFDFSTKQANKKI